MAKRYLVPDELAPGIHVPGRGIYKPGTVVEVPSSAKFIPSRNLIPLNQEAAEELRRVKATYVADLEKRLTKKGAKLDPAEKEALLAVPEIPTPKEEEPPKKDEGVTLRAAAEAEQKVADKTSGKVRAADK